MPVVPDGWVLRVEQRMDAADKRMQHLQEQIDAMKSHPSTADRLLGLSLQIDNLTKRIDAIGADMERATHSTMSTLPWGSKS